MYILKCLLQSLHVRSMGQPYPTNLLPVTPAPLRTSSGNFIILPSNHQGSHATSWVQTIVHAHMRALREGGCVGGGGWTPVAQACEGIVKACMRLSGPTCGYGAVLQIRASISVRPVRMESMCVLESNQTCHGAIIRRRIPAL